MTKCRHINPLPDDEHKCDGNTTLYKGLGRTPLLIENNTVQVYVYSEYTDVLHTIVDKLGYPFCFRPRELCKPSLRQSPKTVCIRK